MRVVAGTAKNRRLVVPRGSDVRPTADRVRESLFSIISARVPDAVVLDLYCGSGALAIEALSRGASSAVLVDRSSAAVDAARGNIEATGVADRATVVRSPVDPFGSRPRDNAY